MNNSILHIFIILNLFLITFSLKSIEPTTTSSFSLDKLKTNIKLKINGVADYMRNISDEIYEFIYQTFAPIHIVIKLLIPFLLAVLAVLYSFNLLKVPSNLTQDLFKEHKLDLSCFYYNQYNIPKYMPAKYDKVKERLDKLSVIKETLRGVDDSTKSEIVLSLLETEVMIELQISKESTQKNSVKTAQTLLSELFLRVYQYDCLKFKYDKLELLDDKRLELKELKDLLQISKNYMAKLINCLDAVGKVDSSYRYSFGSRPTYIWDLASLKTGTAIMGIIAYSLTLNEIRTEFKTSL